MPAIQLHPDGAFVGSRANARSGVHAIAAVVLAASLSATFASAQITPSKLPPNQPTSLPAANPLAAASSSSTTQAALPSHFAHVTYTGGQLEIHANNSSLNQILRSIAHLTGLKINGGVPEQRVFGAYGPAPVSSVLATLLDGTGTNILLMEGDSENPPRLVLTPRSGGAAPPSPDSPVYAAYDGENNQNSAVPPTPPTSIQPPQSQPQTPANSNPRSIPQPSNDVNGSASNSSPTASTLPTAHSVPLDSVPTPSTTPSTPGIVDAPNPPAPGSTTGTDPNGGGTSTPALTPQMVAQKLLQMQQQQSAQQPTNAAPPH